jgi:hypothetical protein
VVKSGGARFLLATSACAIASMAQAGETTTYTYDALGRLIASTSSGTVNNGLTTAIGYDPAGNRASYGVTGAGTGGGGTPPPSPPPSPPPPPPPSNNPPVANADAASVARCASVVKNVLSNDTDPEGNYPLSLTRVSYSGTRGTASMSNATSVQFDSNGVTGAASVIYTVQDSLGATSTGTLTVTVTSTNQCM